MTEVNRRKFLEGSAGAVAAATLGTGTALWTPGSPHETRFWIGVMSFAFGFATPFAKSDVSTMKNPPPRKDMYALVPSGLTAIEWRRLSVPGLGTTVVHSPISSNLPSEAFETSVTSIETPLPPGVDWNMRARSAFFGSCHR